MKGIYMNKCIRHGEAMLIPVKNVRMKGKSEDKNSVIVAHSETGHHHVLESPTAFMTKQDKDELYVRLFKPGQLKHRKTVDAHKTLDVPAGTYKVVHKTEYDPWQQVIRRVFD